MEDNNLMKSLALLTGLKNNIPNGWVLRKYGDEFNSILIALERESSLNLVEFVIPEHEFESRRYHTGEYCDRKFLLMKIDGVLGYFTLLLQPSEVKNKMGFHVEEK